MDEKALKSKEFKKLYAAMASLESPTEAKKFLRDICTISELTAISERLQVAEMVVARVPYRKINQLTGVSTATITRVAHWLKHGLGGYQIILNRLKSNQ